MLTMVVVIGARGYIVADGLGGGSFKGDTGPSSHRWPWPGPFPSPDEHDAATWSPPQQSADFSRLSSLVFKPISAP